MPAGAITLSDIKSADWSLMLDSLGLPGSGMGKVVKGVDDVDQCIAIILTTPKGTDVLRPTFGTESFAVESHLLNFHPLELAPETEVEISFLQRLRDEIKFPSIEALKEQIGRDVRKAERYFQLANAATK